MMRKYGCLLLPLLLIGCGETKEILGLDRAMPDEFAVVDRAPLVLPPDYALRPPQPGAPRPQEQAAGTQAETALFGVAEAANGDVSGLDQQVIRLAGADKATPGIRKIINSESDTNVTSSRHLVDDLLWWRKREDGAAVVDAAREAERLRGNQAAGKPAGAGATPIIEKRKSGWLGL